MPVDDIEFGLTGPVHFCAAVKAAPKAGSVVHFAAAVHSAIADEAAPLRLSAAVVDGAVIAELRRLIAAPEVAARVIATYRQDGTDVEAKAIVEALQRFDDLWDALFPAEQARIVRLLVGRVTVGPAGIAVDLRNNGLAALVRDLSANAHQEAAE